MKNNNQVDAQDIYEELSHWATKNNYINTDIAFEIEIPKKEARKAIKYLKSRFNGVDDLINELVKSCIK